MHKLLVSIDASECAGRALDYALGLAKDNGPMELHVVNAHDEPILYGEIVVYTDLAKLKAAQEAHSQSILGPALAKARNAGIKATSEILVGDVPRMVADSAKRNGCDAIVLGTRGMGALGNLVLGSVATKIVHATDLPVILVK